MKLTPRGQRSRQRLLEAAEKIFGEKGYFPASVSDITRAAGVAQGTFYLYFASKREVFSEVLAWLGQLIRRHTRAAIEHASDRIHAEELGFAAFFTLVNERPHLYRVVRQAEFVDPEAFRAYYASIVQGYVRRIAKAMDRGEVRRLHPEALVYCLLGVGDLIGMRWAYWTGKPVPRGVFQTVTSFVRGGMDPNVDSSRRSGHETEVMAREVLAPARRGRAPGAGRRRSRDDELRRDHATQRRRRSLRK